jgi:MFS family permease
VLGKTSLKDPLTILVSAAMASSLGDGVQLVAVPLLASTLTHDPSVVAAIVAAPYAPALVLSLPIGSVVDRFARVPLMAFADGLRLAVLVALALAIGLRIAPLECLAGAVILVGSGDLLFNTASPAALVDLLPDAMLTKGNARLATLSELTDGLVGPTLAGPIFALYPWLPFLFNAMSFGISALCVASLAKIESPRKSHKRGGTHFNDIREGLRWTMSRPRLRTMLAVTTLWNLIGWMPEGIFVLYARQLLHASPSEFGLLFAATSVGAFLVGLRAEAIVNRLGPQLVFAVAPVLYATLLFPLAIAHAAWIAGILLVMQGASLVPWAVSSKLLRQRSSPREMQGRVNSIFQLLGAGLVPVGWLTGGYLASQFGLRSVFLISGSGMVIGLAALSGHLRRLVRSDGLSPVSEDES